MCMNGVSALVPGTVSATSPAAAFRPSTFLVEPAGLLGVAAAKRGVVDTAELDGGGNDVGHRATSPQNRITRQES
jgi:hypothetical protein